MDTIVLWVLVCSVMRHGGTDTIGTSCGGGEIEIGLRQVGNNVVVGTAELGYFFHLHHHHHLHLLL